MLLIVSFDSHTAGGGEEVGTDQKPESQRTKKAVFTARAARDHKGIPTYRVVWGISYLMSFKYAYFNILKGMSFFLPGFV